MFHFDKFISGGVCFRIERNSVRSIAVKFQFPQPFHPNVCSRLFLFMDGASFMMMIAFE